MKGDRSRPDCPEVVGVTEKSVRTVFVPGIDRVLAALEAWVAVGRMVAITGDIAHAVLLLAAGIWLSQAIFVRQIMMMMRAQGFAEAPSVRATLIQSVAPILLAAGLATRPVALLLILRVRRETNESG